MKKPVFEGTATAIVTPFKDGTIDFDVFRQLLERQISAGIDAIVVCGTTGESATLSDQEKLDLIACAIQYTAGRCKIIAGTGSNNTAHAIGLSRVAASMGADALLLVTPYYNKCTQDGLIRHFSDIADAAGIDCIIYTVPSRTGMDVTAETCKKLSAHPLLNGIKEASGSISKAARIRNVCGDDFFIWSGNDDQTVPLMSLGAKGVISVLSNVRPEKTVQMTHLCLSGNVLQAGKMQTELMDLIDALFCEVNPIPVKKALELEGTSVGLPRMPLTELSVKNTARLKSALSAV